MSYDKETVEELLTHDALGEAEAITGKSYKDDKDTANLGVALLMDASRKRAEVLAEMKDTHMRMTWDEMLIVVADLGFEEILNIDFEPVDPWGETKQESQKFFWHPDGILLKTDSYNNRTTVNSADILYNIEFSPERMEEGQWSRATSSGSFVTSLYNAGRYVWTGHSDAREGLRHKLDAIRSYGTFLPVWEEPPFLYFVHYGNKNDDNYREVTKEVISQFPEHVVHAMAS